MNAGATTGIWHLDAPPDELVEEIRFAKELAGESFDGEPERQVLARVEREIAAAQKTLRPLIGADRALMVFRAMQLTPADLAALAADGALGDCWSYDVRGAHGYFGRAGGDRQPYVFAASVAADDVHWPMTLAMLSSGEAEIRLNANATLRLAWIRPGTPHRLGDAVRGDLTGALFNAGHNQATAPAARR